MKHTLLACKTMQQHLQFVLNWKNVSSSRPLTTIRMYFTVMFKMLQRLFSGYFRNLLQLKRNELYIGYPCIFITLLLPQGKISFPTRLKKNRTATTTGFYPCTVPIFTWSSCFQSPASTCRPLSSCNKIGSCFKTNRRDSWA